MAGLLDTVSSLASGGTPANASHYEFDVKGLAPGSFTVQGFQTSRHALSRDYEFRVEVVGRLPFDLDQVLGGQATLAMRWSGDRVRVHGLVSHVTQNGDSPDGERYVICLSSPLYPLGQSRRNRVFLNKSVTEIATEVLTTAGFEDTGFRIEAKGNYSPREFVVQYDESDLEFIQRLLAFDGLFFAFHQQQDDAVLLIHDDIEALTEILGAVPLGYEVQTGQNRTAETVFALRRRVELRTRDVRLKDYNYRTPEQSLLAETSSDSGTPAEGTDYRYGEHYADLGEGDRLARIRQEALDWRRDTVVAESDCRGLVPGMRLVLSGHPDRGINGDWIVVEMEHTADQSGGLAFSGEPKAITYANRMLLLRAGTPYRTAEIERRPVYGVFNAKVESAGGEYAYLDDQGRYRVRLPFDLGDAPQGEASHPVRMMQPYGGREYGMHFPLHDGAEVAIACVNGDVCRPVIVGVLSNTASPSPVTAANNSQNVIRTWGGNELVMEDRAGQERIELFTRDRKNVLRLDAKSDGHEVRLATDEGDMQVYAGKNMLIEAGADQTVQVGGKQEITVEDSQRVLTKKGELEFQAATDLLLKAAENIRFAADTGDIEVNAEQDVVVQSGANLSLEVVNQDASVLVEHGSFSLQAKKDITFLGQGNGTIHIGQGQGSIEIADSGDLTIEAPKVEISGQSIAIKGQSVANNS